MTREIIIAPYNINWPLMYKRESSTIKDLLGSEIIDIYHIGSTSIPGSDAKPIIDILIAVKSVDVIDKLEFKMIGLKYRPMGEFGIKGRRFFIKGTDEERTHHVHVFQGGDPEIKRHLHFRDYLTKHPEEIAKYGQLKRKLAKKYKNNIDRYTKGKSAFIARVNKITCL